MKRNTAIGRIDPGWVDAILDWPWTWLVARIGLTAPFIVGALMKLSDLHGAALEQERVGLHPGLPWALLTIAVEVTGPMLIISGRYVWLGAGMLGIFTCLANLLVNRFWEMAGDGRFVATNSFFEHIALIAGFILAALVAEQEYRQRQAARPKEVD
jgi:uncharacterized membrane protein YphA (DoxX/SURF4 family)